MDSDQVADLIAELTDKSRWEMILAKDFIEAAADAFEAEAMQRHPNNNPFNKPAFIARAKGEK